MTSYILYNYITLELFEYLQEIRWSFNNDKNQTIQVKTINLYKKKGVYKFTILENGDLEHFVSELTTLQKSIWFG